MNGFRLAAVTVLGLASLHANAATYSCVGKISHLGLDQVGQVVVAAGTPINIICGIKSLPSITYAIEPEACKAMYATLLAARVSGRSVAIYYHSPPAAPACDQITPWSQNPGAYYVELMD